MNPATKQDVQSIVDNSRARILERTVTKQDINGLSDLVRQIATLQQQNQQLLKQGEQQRLQLLQRLQQLEARLISTEQSMRSLASAVSKTTGQPPQQIILPVQATDEKAIKTAAQYAFYRA